MKRLFYLCIIMLIVSLSGALLISCQRTAPAPALTPALTPAPEPEHEPVVSPAPAEAEEDLEVNFIV
ncbi:hypothetical protein ACFLVS_03245 [Chloroflexota bacterium]